MLSILKEITLARIAAVVICGISIACNFQFGMTLGVLIACLFVGSDILKSESLRWASNHMKNICPVSKKVKPNYGWAVSSVLIFFACTIASLSSGYGYFVLLKNNASSGINAVKEDYRLTVEKKKDLEQKIKEQGQHRPTAAIAALIQKEESKERYWSDRLSKKCTNATSSASKAFCDNLGRLRVELAAAQTALPKIKKLEARLDDVNQKLDGFNLQTVKKSSDIQSESIARALGVEVEMATLYIAYVITALIELGSGLGMFLAFNTKTPREDLLKHELDIEKKNVVQKSIEVQKVKKETKKLEANVADADGLNRFLCPHNGIIEAADKRIADKIHITARDLYSTYKDWCEDNGVFAPLNRNQFGKTLKQHGYKKTRLNATKENPNRPTVYLGIQYKTSQQNVVPLFS